MHDFSKWKCRASQIGLLMTPPKDKAAKEKGELGESAKTSLIEAYVRTKYSRESDIYTKEMEKGVLMEQAGADLFTEVTGKQFKIHKKYLENDFFSGHIDLYCGESIENVLECWDIKNSWNMKTFMDNVMKPLNPLYKAQIRIYYNLLGCRTGGIAQTLVTAPEHLINDELFRLAKRMGIIDTSVHNPDYEEAAAKLEYSLRFDDIDPKERLLQFQVEQDDEFIELAQQKVVQARIFLQEIERKHLSFNKIQDKYEHV